MRTIFSFQYIFVDVATTWATALSMAAMDKIIERFSFYYQSTYSLDNVNKKIVGEVKFCGKRKERKKLRCKTHQKYP